MKDKIFKYLSAIVAITQLFFSNIPIVIGVVLSESNMHLMLPFGLGLLVILSALVKTNNRRFHYSSLIGFLTIAIALYFNTVDHVVILTSLISIGLLVLTYSAQLKLINTIELSLLRRHPYLAGVIMAVLFFFQREFQLINPEWKFYATLIIVLMGLLLTVSIERYGKTDNRQYYYFLSSIILLSLGIGLKILDLFIPAYELNLALITLILISTSWLYFQSILKIKQ